MKLVITGERNDVELVLDRLSPRQISDNPHMTAREVSAREVELVSSIPGLPPDRYIFRGTRGGDDDVPACPPDVPTARPFDEADYQRRLNEVSCERDKFFAEINAMQGKIERLCTVLNVARNFAIRANRACVTDSPSDAIWWYSKNSCTEENISYGELRTFTEAFQGPDFAENITRPLKRG